ncbi:MAG: DUF3467 domain-containing protein [Flavobacteriales bacterium]|nr:DUF3467 domain-containing protein [Flavobacteriales bacterium]
MEEPKDNQPQLNIELTEEVAEGIYSNFAILSHSNAEFIIDFVRIMPMPSAPAPKGKVKSRIVLSPQHAKRLQRAIADNIAKYEATYGPIKDVEGGGGNQGGVPMSFGPPAQA